MTGISVGVEAHRNYQPTFGYDPNDPIDRSNVCTLDQARSMYDRGEYFCLLFGDPINPEYYIEIFEGDFQTRRRIDIDFLSDLKSKRRYFTEFSPKEFDGAEDMLIVQYHSDFRNSVGHRGDILVADVFVTGDLPTIEYDMKEFHAISVRWQDFFIGPPPSFDELIDGTFVARLPKITRPPHELLDTYIPQAERKPKAPKRVPRGRFPW